MNVSELIEMLKTCDQEALVVLAADAEGNYFEPMEELGPSYFEDGEVNSEGPGFPCVVLWP